MIDLITDVKECSRYFIGSPKTEKDNQHLILEGTLGCRVQDYENVYDFFEVTIKIPIDFPKKLPSVIERSNKIPRLKDFHINEKGECCLGTKIALYDYIHQYNIRTFAQFLEQVIIIHFFQVSYALKNKGQWLSMPEEHNTTGVIHSYMRVFGITEEQLQETLSRKIKKHSACLCGSGKRYDKCHGKYIPAEQVLKDFIEMKEYYKEIKRKNEGKIPIDIRNLNLCDRIIHKEMITQRRY